MDGKESPSGWKRFYTNSKNMIFSPNNSAKEWIFRQLATRAEQGPFSVCDFACGSGSTWYELLKAYPSIQYLGSDTDVEAVERAKKIFADIPNARFEIADGQRARTDLASYDVVTTLSSLEHVVRVDKFLDTIFSVLKPGGIAYLNYDNGHFHSHDLKERLMVPVSQILAKFGIEGPYMKEVFDEDVVRLVKERGVEVLQVRRHLFGGMKGLMKGYRDGSVPAEALEAWFAFEDRLNELLPAEKLALRSGSSVVVAQKK